MKRTNNCLAFVACSLVAFNLSCKLPESIQKYNQESLWQKIEYRFHHNNPIVSDTAFIMISNRTFAPGKLKFANENIDTSKIHILYIAKHDSIWQVQELETLLEGIQKFTPRHWVLYTEGMGKLFTSNIERAYLMTKTYHVNVILFDYASVQSKGNMLQNYRFSYQNSENSTSQYYTLLQELKKLKSDTGLLANVDLTLFFHSMGNIIFKKMMKNKNSTESLNNKVFVQNVICNAACVNRKNHQQWMSKIRFAKRVYVTYNSKDKNLQAAQIISGNRKLGSKPIYPFAKNVYYINFHKEVGSNHSYFLNIPGRNYFMNEQVQFAFTTLLQGKFLAPNFILQTK